jgi:hypothetical protein
MKSFIVITVIFAATLAACSTLGTVVGDARTVLDSFCRLKQTQIAQILLTPQQLAAGRIVCYAIKDPLGVP